MVVFIQIVHILVSILLIVSVMLQGGENVDITAAFGGVSQAAFGPRGSVTLLAKITWGLALIFILTSLSLAVHASRSSSGSVLERAPVKSSAPARPTTPMAPTMPMAPAPLAPVPAKK